MKKTIYLLSFLFGLSLIVKAQGNEGSIFLSQAEEDFFGKLTNNQHVSTVELFLSMVEDSAEKDGINKRINDFIADIKKKGIEKKSERQKIKLLFNEIHKRFFVIYTEEAYFNDIFRNGKFNCVTATALYAIILEHFQIPFAIKELPTHVFVVAYPNQFNIMMESTSPKGFYAPSDSEKEKYLKNLVEMKLLSDQEVRQKGIGKAFNDFFYPNENIDARQLAGLQYYNVMVKHSQSKDFAQAYKAIKKAELLYPCNRMKYSKAMVLSEIISNSNFSNESDLDYLVEFINEMEYENSKKFFLGKFEEISQSILMKQSNSVKYIRYYQKIAENLQNEEIKKEFKEIYCYFLGGWYANSARYTDALNLVREGMEINPNNSYFHNIIVYSLVNRYSRSFGQAVIDTLIRYENDYPFLKENNRIQSFKLFQYIYLTYQYFEDERERDGEKTLKIIEQMLSENEELEYDKPALGTAYTVVAAYYFRQRNFSKCKAIIDNGLKYAPDHQELKMTMQILQDEMKRRNLKFIQ